MAEEKWRMQVEPYYAGDRIVAEVQIVTADGSYVALLPGGVSKEIDRRAWLIAASPALLEACEALLRESPYVTDVDKCECVMFDNGTCAHTLARAAIAAAAGGE